MLGPREKKEAVATGLMAYHLHLLQMICDRCCWRCRSWMVCPWINGPGPVGLKILNIMNPLRLYGINEHELKLISCEAQR